ncbi:MAG TPA: Fmu (Sun) domain-containing protein, partial [Chitinophagaceae bacterium]|nr:Fmu (Sun) domain-containing protein [Chitinophagaceae bacterium]
DRQQKIVMNAAKKLANGGYLLYITCSVFKKENEEMAAFIQRETGMELITSQFFRGYSEKADSMYAAMFRRNL